MNAYYKFEATEDQIEMLDKVCAEWEKELNKKDSYCLFKNYNSSYCFYACDAVGIDDTAILQELDGREVFSITKKEFAIGTVDKKRAYIKGSRNFLLVIRR